MSKEKNKNNNTSSASVGAGITGYKKYTRIFITTFLVVVFISGLGIIALNHFKKSTHKSATVSGIDLSAIPAWWSQQYFASSVCDKDACKPEADPDHDGLTNAQEFYYHTSPIDPFTIKDKLNDGQLVAAGFDPSRLGHMTFSQVMAPDNVLGESLLVGQDLKDIVAQQNDINKVPLPLVTDDQIKTSQDQSPEVAAKYISDLSDTIARYFSQDDLSNIGQLLKSGSASDIQDVKTKSALLASDLQAMTVPKKMLMYHKYTLAFFQILPKVLLSPGDPALNTSSPASDVWYDNAQALFAASEKLTAEGQRLNIQQ